MLPAQGGGGGAKGGGKKGGGKGGIPAPLTIMVAGYSDGGMIPDSIGCAASGMQKDSPKIDWKGAPDGTAAFALIMHDTDVTINPAANPDVLHWAIFDIPGTATGLPAECTQKDGYDARGWQRAAQQYRRNAGLL